MGLFPSEALTVPSCLVVDVGLRIFWTGQVFSFCGLDVLCFHSKAFRCCVPCEEASKPKMSLKMFCASGAFVYLFRHSSWSPNEHALRDKYVNNAVFLVS